MGGTQSEIGSSDRPKPVPPLLALVSLLTAWGAVWLGQYRTSWLDLSRFGPCEDVCEALGRDGYVAGVLLPYYTAAVWLDGLAVVALIGAGVAGQFRVVGSLVTLLCVLTTGWHLLGWVVTSIFAT